MPAIINELIRRGHPIRLRRNVVLLNEGDEIARSQRIDGRPHQDHNEEDHHDGDGQEFND